MSINIQSPKPVSLGTVEASAKPGTLQRYLFRWFLLAVLWLIVGKSLFGAVGWVTAIMLFTVAPALIIYGTALWLIAKIRNKRSGYLMSRTLRILVIVLLLNLFVYGLVVLDGGDTRESGRSALTSIFGINMANGAEHPVMQFTNWASGKSIFLNIILLPTVFFMMLFERRGSPNNLMPTKE